MNVFELVGSFSMRGMDEARSDIDSVTRSAKDAGDDVEKLGRKSKEAGEKAEQGFKKADVALGSFLGTLASNAFSAGLDMLTNAFGALVDAATESQEDMGKLSVAFDKAGYSAETANAVYGDLVGLLGETDQSVEAANHLAKLCNSEEELAQWANIAAGAYAEFGDSLPLEGLTEAANETAKVGQVTGPLADVLNWAALEGETFGVTLRENIEFTKLSKKEYDKLTDAQKAQYDAQKEQYDTINDWNKAVEEAVSAEDRFNLALQMCADESERSALITQTLSDIYGEAGATYRKTNEELVAYRESQAKVNTGATEAGNALLPLLTHFQNLGAGILTDAAPALQLFTAFVLDEALPAMQDFGGFIMDTAIPAFVDASPVIVGAATAIGGIAIAANASAIALGIKTAAMTVSTTVTNGLAVAQGALNAVMMANPIGIVVALLAGLVAAITVAWNTSEDFRNAVETAWTSIKTLAEDVWGAVTGFFSQVPEKVGEFLSGVPDAVTEAFADAGEWLVEAGGRILSGLWEGITGGLGWFGDQLAGIGEFIIEHKGPPEYDSEMLKDNGSRILSGLVDGITGGMPQLKSALDSVNKTIADSVATEDMAFAMGYSGARGFAAEPAAGAVYNIYIEGVRINDDPAIEGRFYDLMLDLKRLANMEGGE